MRLLAVSTHVTEISYAISDMQTSIFGEAHPLSWLNITLNRKKF